MVAMLLKKHIFFIFMVISVCMFAPLYATPIEATVVSTKGKVEIQKNNEWIPLAAGDKVGKGSIVSTGFKSEAVIKVKESLLKIDSLTRITIEQLSETAAKDETMLFVDTGKISSTVKQTENKRVDFTVRSSVATASVRGTAFSFASDGSVECTEGAIALWPTPPEQKTSTIQAEPDETVPAAGTSTAATPATDIAPKAAANAIVVLANQSASVSAAGITTTPKTKADIQSSGESTVIKTASDTESTVTSEVTEQTTTATVQTETKGTAVVTITWSN